MSSFFKSKPAKVEFQQPEAFRRTTDELGNFFNENVGQPGPEFKGERVAPLTDRQQLGLESLDRFIADSKTVPETFNLADQAIKDLLEGSGDAADSTLFKGFRASAKREQDDALQDVASRAGGGGRFFSGARLATEGDVITDTTNSLNQVLGGLTENNLNRRLAAVPQAINVGQTIRNLPLIDAQNILAVGDIERQISQAENDAAYQDFIRRFQDFPLSIANAATGFTSLGAPQSFVTPGTPSPFTQLLPTALTALGAAAGGPAGAAAGNSAGQGVAQTLNPGQTINAVGTSGQSAPVSLIRPITLGG